MITQLQLKQFRNYPDLSLSFDHNTIAITGPNASGKTNILEAIYVSSVTKSFRGSDKTLLQHEQSFYTIDKVQNNESVHVRLKLHNDSLTKQAKIHKKPVSLISLIGRYPITLFEPNDIQLLTGLPGIRRDYINKVLSQIDKQYLIALREYNKVLKQRNNLLRQAKKHRVNNLDEQLFVYTIQLAKPAYYISQKRQTFITTIQELITPYYQSVSHDKKRISITYYPSVTSEDQFMNEQNNRISTDKSAGFTTYGPHREDFTTLLNDNVLSEVASRGEIRTLVLAYKIAELDYIEQALSIRPTLLLDDVLSELDDERQRLLFMQLSRQQTFITTTHLPENMKFDFQHITLPL